MGVGAPAGILPSTRLFCLDYKPRGLIGSDHVEESICHPGLEERSWSELCPTSSGVLAIIYIIMSWVYPYMYS